MSGEMLPNANLSYPVVIYTNCERQRSTKSGVRTLERESRTYERVQTLAEPVGQFTEPEETHRQFEIAALADYVIRLAVHIESGGLIARPRRTGASNQFDVLPTEQETRRLREQVSLAIWISADESGEDGESQVLAIERELSLLPEAIRSDLERDNQEVLARLSGDRLRKDPPAESNANQLRRALRYRTAFDRIRESRRSQR